MAKDFTVKVGFLSPSKKLIIVFCAYDITHINAYTDMIFGGRWERLDNYQGRPECQRSFKFDEKGEPSKNTLPAIIIENGKPEIIAGEAMIYNTDDPYCH